MNLIVNRIRKINTHKLFIDPKVVSLLSKAPTLGPTFSPCFRRWTSSNLEFLLFSGWFCSSFFWHGIITFNWFSSYKVKVGAPNSCSNGIKATLIAVFFTPVTHLFKGRFIRGTETPEINSEYMAGLKRRSDRFPTISNHQFSGVNSLLVSGRVVFCYIFDRPPTQLQ